MSSCQHFEAAQECSFIRRKSNKSWNKWKFYFFSRKRQQGQSFAKTQKRNSIGWREKKRRKILKSKSKFKFLALLKQEKEISHSRIAKQFTNGVTPSDFWSRATKSLKTDFKSGFWEVKVKSKTIHYFITDILAFETRWWLLRNLWVCVQLKYQKSVAIFLPLGSNLVWVVLREWQMRGKPDYQEWTYSLPIEL